MHKVTVIDIFLFSVISHLVFHSIIKKITI